MTETREVLCIGSVLWDVIGRSSAVMRVGTDVPGRITRLPGGVALNIAMTLRRFSMTPVLLTAVGRDAEGDELVAAVADLGIVTRHIYRSIDLPTDRYMAVEGANGLIAAIADAHTLEAADDKILKPLSDGSLGSVDAPYGGLIALDGNLTERLLAKIAVNPLFAASDLRVAPASPGKAERLLALLGCANATVYVNLEEAGILCHTTFSSAPSAAEALFAKSAARCLVTNGGEDAAFASAAGIITATPPEVLVTRVTGAGDTFMAAHIAAEARNEDDQGALEAALRAAAAYVSGDVPS